MSKFWGLVSPFVASAGAVLLLSAPAVFAANRAVMEGLPATNNAILVSTGSTAATSRVTVQNLSIDQLNTNQCVQTALVNGHVGLVSSGGQCGGGSGGSSALAIAVGGVNVSSPTSIVNLSSASFAGTIAGGATAQVTLLPNQTFGGTVTAGVLNSTAPLQLNGSNFLSGLGGTNVFVGLNGNTTTTSVDNTCVGDVSCLNLTTGAGGNSAYGFQAGKSITTGVANTCLGFNACTSVTTSSFNVAVGDEAGTFLTSGGQNVLMGEQAGFKLGAGSANTLIGYNAGDFMTGASNNNTMLGMQAGASISSGTANTFIGYNNGQNIVAGSSNTIVGASADDSGSSSGADTALVLIGYGATTSAGSTLTNAIAIGYNAVAVASNTAVIGGAANSSNAMTLQVSSMTTSMINLPLAASVVNSSAGYINFGAASYMKVTVSSSIYIGAQAGGAFGTEEVAIGDHAGGSGNRTGLVAIGDYAGFGAGSESVAIGDQALGQNSTTAQPYDVAIGYQSQTQSSAAGSYNTSVGAYSLGGSSLSGYQSTAIGAFALNALTTGLYNTALGYRSLYADTIGGNNVAVGNWTLNYTTNSVNNVAIGEAAGGDDSETGGENSAKFVSNSTFLGAATGVVSTGTVYSNASALGYGAIVGCSNCMVLGQTGTKIGIGTSVPAALLEVNGTMIVDSSATVGSATSTSLGNNPYLTVNSSGTSQNILLVVNGIPSGGYQNQVGAFTIKSIGTSPATDMVIVDSTTDSQQGTGLIEIWSNNPLHNDPKLWFHVAGHDSSPEIRDDAQAPNWEMINLSTDNTHGYGKFEPAAVAYQGVYLQRNSRSQDNSTFENVELMYPLSLGGGLEFAPATTANGDTYGSETAPIRFDTTNSHHVDLTGPFTSGASWSFALPGTPNNLGQVMIQSDNGRGGVLNARSLGFTSGGTAGYFLTYTGTSSVPVWNNTVGSSITVAGILNTVHTGTPSLTSCGSSPSITGNDRAGVITEGSGSTTSCTITFATTWTSAPYCVASTTSTVVQAASSIPSTTQFVINSGVNLAADTLQYNCSNGRD